MNLKKTTALILAMLMLAGMLSGCGGKDWSKASFTDYDPDTFLAKTDIEYSLGVYAETTSVDQYAAWSPTHVMLYKDGSAAGVTGFDQKSAFRMFNAGCGVEPYDKNCITGVFYGSWSKNGDTVTIKLQGLKLGEYYAEGQPIEGVALEDVLQEFEYEADVEDGVLTIVDFQTLGNGLVSHPLQSTNIKANLQEFVDSLPEGNLVAPEGVN